MVRCSVAALSKNKAGLQHESQRTAYLSMCVGENTELFGVFLLEQAKAREPNCVKHIVLSNFLHSSVSFYGRKKRKKEEKS